MSNVVHLPSSAMQVPSMPLSGVLKDIKTEASSPPLSLLAHPRTPSPPRPTTVPELVDLHQPSHSPERRKVRSPSSLPRRREEGHVRRPANPFILFACTIRAQYKGADNRKLSKIAGDAWRALSDAEKKFWRDQAEKVKEKHAEEHPDYQYRPRRRDMGHSPPPRKGKSVKKAAGELESIFPAPEDDIEMMFPTMGISRDVGRAREMGDVKGEAFDDGEFGGLMYPTVPMLGGPVYGEAAGDPLTPPTSATMVPEYFPAPIYHHPSSPQSYIPQSHWNSNVIHHPIPKPFIPNISAVPNAYRFPPPQAVDYHPAGAFNNKFEFTVHDSFVTHCLPTPYSQIDVPFSYMATLPNH